MRSRIAVLPALALLGGCVLLTGVGNLTTDDADAAATDSAPSALTDVMVSNDTAAPDVQVPAPDAGGDAATCNVCTGLVSAYRFADGTALGLDTVGQNTMGVVHGTPKQSSTTPPGMTGHSIEFDGSSSVCIENAFTFDASKDHTLCWWSRPSALADQTNQFAQTCAYDTWTSSTGADYEWRINNCNGDGGVVNLEVPSVYAVGQWVQICQSYRSSTLQRTIVINGHTSAKTVTTDTVPIRPSDQPWCIGSYSGTGAFWKGLVYLPLWFDRVLTDAEIEAVSARACCLP